VRSRRPVRRPESVLPSGGLAEGSDAKGGRRAADALTQFAALIASPRGRGDAVGTSQGADEVFSLRRAYSSQSAWAPSTRGCVV